MSLNSRERRTEERTAAQKSHAEETARAAATQATQKRPSARQWRPDDRPRNCMMPKTLRRVEDLFSPAQNRVLDAMTTKAPSGGAVRRVVNDWHCTMSYDTIARIAGVCRKTVIKTIKRAVKLGLITVFETITQGGRRTNTHYIIHSFKVFLEAIRSNPEYFHTADGHVIGRGRVPEIMTPADAQGWNINPHLPPAPRSLGPSGGAQPQTGRRKPREYTTLDIEIILAEFRKAETSHITADAAKILTAAQEVWTEAGQKDGVDSNLVAGIMTAITRAYRPNSAYPVPQVGWFVREIPKRLQAWIAQHQPAARSRTG